MEIVLGVVLVGLAMTAVAVKRRRSGGSQQRVEPARAVLAANLAASRRR